jgi:CubicO group peptidase (beta-lactamase class C family)/D-alanyl-D-alanine dipeptidase
MTNGPCPAGSRLLICAVRIVAFLSLLNGRISSARAEQIVEPRDPYIQIARLLDPWITAEVRQKGIPALSIALVDDDHLVWARGFGFADAEKRVPATADTVYRVGSVSKLFTDLAVMQLVEQARLDLDAPVAGYLPEFAPLNPFTVPITLRQLMSHRSGLVREPPAGHYFDPVAPSLDAVVRSLARTTLVFEPGTRTKYSNAGVTVVGAVVEKMAKEPFPGAIDRALFRPLRMTRTSFQPSPEIAGLMAHGSMWTYDGQIVKTPTFLLGTGPAGNLVSSVTDLARFLSFLFAEGRAGPDRLINADTLKTMIEPQLAKPGEAPPGFGLGFAISKLENERRIGHGGAIYGFATEVQALPDAKLGAVVVATADCANGFTQHVAEGALRLMLAQRQGRPLPALSSSEPIPNTTASKLAGWYTHGEKAVDLAERNGKLFLSPFAGATRVEVRSIGSSFVVDDRLAHGPRLKFDGNHLLLGAESYEKTPDVKPAVSPTRWNDFIGEYGWDHDVLYILEKKGKLHALIEWFFEYPLEEDGPDRFRFPAYGLYASESVIFHRDGSGKVKDAEAASVVFARRQLDGEDGRVFRIQPVRPVDTLRAQAELASPPAEKGEFLEPDLVELAALDPSIKLDIRYSTANNFLSVAVYTTAKAFMQRRAAEAVVRAHQSLLKQGYGLLIHDAYRPWRVTKVFWDAVPESGKIFVADPAKGSKHNRGAAVDLTLYDRATGKPVEMVGGYDEFSPRSFPDYPGGTSLARWHRDLLRHAMEAEGFTVYEYEWWHFDHRDWSRYPILNRRFEDLPDRGNQR